MSAYPAERGADWQAASAETLISLMDDQLLSAVAFFLGKVNYSFNSLRRVELPCNNRQFREDRAGTLLFKDYALAINHSSESLSILCASKPLNMAVISQYLNISLRARLRLMAAINLVHYLALHAPLIQSQ